MEPTTAPLLFIPSYSKVWHSVDISFSLSKQCSALVIHCVFRVSKFDLCFQLLKFLALIKKLSFVIQMSQFCSA